MSQTKPAICHLCPKPATDRIIFNSVSCPPVSEVYCGEHAPKMRQAYANVRNPNVRNPAMRTKLVSQKLP